NIYSGQTGFDIYTRAISDVYQDLYSEGSFTGKGIYEVSTLHAVLEKRFPRNALLSHDLIEGAYARAGLVTDVEVIDDYPSHYSAYTRRKHRWVRGDWQIAQWLFSRVPDETGKFVRNPISTISRWKILDNLRRSLVEPATMVLLVAGWLGLPGGALYWTLVTLFILFVPPFIQLLFGLGRSMFIEQEGAAQDVVVFEEADERFGVGVGLTRSERYLQISVASTLTSEAWLLDAADPAGEFSVVLPRRQGVEYSVEHQIGTDGDDRLLILHNDHAENFELAVAPLADPSAMAPLIAHRADTRLLDVDAFADYLVVYYRRHGLTGLRIIRGDGTDHEVAFSEPVYTVRPGANREYQAEVFRLGYASLVTPDSVYDCDMATGDLALLKRRPVLPGPDGSEYDPADYEQHRDWATAADGTRIPISLVCRKGTPRDGSAPCLIYGYGSYETSIDPGFSTSRLSLLDRGFSYAIAHVRGGGELGRRWYEEGKLLHKANTFTDFVACAGHLVSQGWTAPSRLAARGGSAGGLLMGAVANLAPGAFGAIVAQVPFVDALTTILDPSLPLTVTEWEEWGDPLHDPQVYAYIKSYSPYENVGDLAYPPILAVTSLNDTRVLYREPAKWIARLQAAGRGGPFLLKTEMVAGHGGRSGRYDSWHEEAYVLAWIASTVGAVAP
ncbi:MAG: prolyl oligopeptidase family serine peptidase, partial [Streptosporangiaceae bacterium]